MFRRVSFVIQMLVTSVGSKQTDNLPPKSQKKKKNNKQPTDK